MTRFRPSGWLADLTNWTMKSGQRVSAFSLVLLAVLAFNVYILIDVAVRHTFSSSSSSSSDSSGISGRVLFWRSAVLDNQTGAGGGATASGGVATEAGGVAVGAAGQRWSQGVDRQTLLGMQDTDLITEAGNIQGVPFDPEGPDVLLFLHVQKTGGSQFELHLVMDTISPPPCACKHLREESYRCSCLNSKSVNWMFQRQNLGWPCGLHPDFTVMTGPCVDRYFTDQEPVPRTRRYHIATILRDPVHRFLSEFSMTRNSGSFQDNVLPCDGRLPTEEELPICHRGAWKGVTFEEFVGCQSNPAFNRMTRMLANLSLVDCYRADSKLSLQERDTLLLQSAKHNLAKAIDYFGLMEYQKESAQLFQFTFQGLTFNLDRFSNWEKTHAMDQMNQLSAEELQKVHEVNALDEKLYAFAREIFLKRLERAEIDIISI